MDDEKLILLVQQNENLYNKQLASFKDVNMKRSVWEAISKELKTSVDAVTKRWTSLRERYNKENRQYVPSGSGNEFKSTWHLYSTMSFLSPYVKPRIPRYSTNILSASVGFDEPAIAAEFTSPLSPVPRSDSRNNLCISPSQFSDVSLSSAAFVPVSPAPMTGRQSASSKPTSNLRASTSSSNRKETALDEAFVEAVTCFKKVCGEKPSTSQNAIDGFVHMIKAVLTEMNPAYQKRAFKDMTAYIMALKEEEEEKENN